MKISCKCITYGRVEFLEESLYSFLNQEYEDENELVIVNDYPLQKLVFDHPRVKIFNLDKTFQTIGEKENFAVSQCKYDVIAVWDDDDIALPNHLSNIKKYFTEGTDLLHWGNGVYFDYPDYMKLTNLGNSGIVYRKRSWERIGGHPLENAGYDMTFTNKLHQAGISIHAHPKDEDVSWIYVWAGRGYHMSGMGTDDGTRPNVIKRHSEHVENLRKQGKIPVGEIILKPNWKINYKQKVWHTLNKQSSVHL